MYKSLSITPVTALDQVTALRSGDCKEDDFSLRCAAFQLVACESAHAHFFSEATSAKRKRLYATVHKKMRNRLLGSQSDTDPSKALRERLRLVVTKDFVRDIIDEHNPQNGDKLDEFFGGLFLDFEVHVSTKHRR
jgi:hypothetical protein